MNGSGEVEDGSEKLAGFYAYRNSFNEHNVWVKVPKRGLHILVLHFEEHQADKSLK